MKMKIWRWMGTAKYLIDYLHNLHPIIRLFVVDEKMQGIDLKLLAFSKICLRVKIWANVLRPGLT
uniref:Uncharacterized protein n=1 Tax=Megaselia scalaris TaxID=36166 RepID=T1H046_MEGSC